MKIVEAELLDFFEIPSFDFYGYLPVISILLSLFALVVSIFRVSTLRQKNDIHKSSHDMSTDWMMRNKAQSFSVSQDHERRRAREILEFIFPESLSVPNPDAEVYQFTVDEVENRCENFDIGVKNHETDYDGVKPRKDKYGNNISGKLALDIILGNYENMALAVQAGVADERFAYDLLGKTFMHYVFVFENYINDKSKKKLRRFPYLIEINKKWFKYKNTNVNYIYTTPLFRELN